MMAVDYSPKRAQRYEASLLVGSDGGEMELACTRNLSISGVFLETESRPAVDTVCTLRFVWGVDTHECQARVVRHAVDGLGLAFVEPDETVVEALQEIMEASTPQTSDG